MTGQGSSWPTLTDAQRSRVEANIGLITFALRRRQVATEEWEDRHQDGVFGLIRAAQLFEPGRGFTFSTYAMYWIKQSIERGREVEAGSGYRRAKAVGTPWEAPLSLERELPGCDPYDDGNPNSLLETLSAVDDLPEETALQRALEHLCRDQMDRDVLEATARGLSLAAVARRHGLSRQAAEQRLRKLRSKAKHPVNRRLIEGAR